MKNSVYIVETGLHKSVWILEPHLSPHRRCHVEVYVVKEEQGSAGAFTTNENRATYKHSAAFRYSVKTGTFSTFKKDTI